MPKKITTQQVDRYWDFRAQNYSIREAALKAGFSNSHGETLEQKRKDRRPTDEKGRQELLKDPLTMPELGPEAKRALDDFGYFQRRYFGRIPFHWQVEAANQVVEMLASPAQGVPGGQLPARCGQDHPVHPRHPGLADRQEPAASGG